MKDINAGLVLEGGGLRGQYTAGVLDAFLQEKFYFPFTIGVSAGASIGCSYISRQFGRNRTIIQNYRRDPRYLSLRNLIFQGSLFGMDFIYGQIPLSLVPFDFETFETSPYRFITVCTDCVTGEPVYYEKGKSDPLKVLRASSSMPFLSPMVEYDGRKLLDGALADSIPLVKALSEGYSRNVVILTREKGYRKKAPSPLAARLVYRKFPRLAEAINTRWKHYNETQELLDREEAVGQAFLIRPSRDMEISRTEKSLKKLDELYVLGYEDGLAAVPRIKSWAQAWRTDGDAGD